METFEEKGWTITLGTVEEQDAMVRATPRLTGAAGVAALEALRAATYGDTTPRLQRVFVLFEEVRR